MQISMLPQSPLLPRSVAWDRSLGVLGIHPPECSSPQSSTALAHQYCPHWSLCSPCPSSWWKTDTKNLFSTSIHPQTPSTNSVLYPWVVLPSPWFLWTMMTRIIRTLCTLLKHNWSPSKKCNCQNYSLNLPFTLSDMCLLTLSVMLSWGKLWFSLLLCVSDIRSVRGNWRIVIQKGIGNWALEHTQRLGHVKHDHAYRQWTRSRIHLWDSRGSWSSDGDVAPDRTGLVKRNQARQSLVARIQIQDVISYCLGKNVNKIWRSPAVDQQYLVRETARISY